MLNLESPLFWVVAVTGAILVGISKGGWSSVAGLGVPVLSLVMNPLLAAGLLLPVFIVSDWFGLYAYRHSFNRRLVAILLPAGLAGVVLGWLTVPWIDTNVPGGERIVTGIVGMIGLVFSLYMLLRHDPDGPAKEARVAPGLFWGAVAGFTSYISHSGGPPYQTYVQPLRLDRLAFAGTTTIIFAVINASKLPFYWMTGQFSVGNLWVAAFLAVPAVGGVFLGKAMVGWVSEATFYKVITWTLLAVSLKLLWDAGFGA